MRENTTSKNVSVSCFVHLKSVFENMKSQSRPFQCTYKTDWKSRIYGVSQNRGPVLKSIVVFEYRGIYMRMDKYEILYSDKKEH